MTNGKSSRIVLVLSLGIFLSARPSFSEGNGGVTLQIGNGDVSAFGAYGDALRGQAAYIRAVGEARLLWAKARYEEALAAGQEERVRQLIEYGKRLRLDLWRLRKEEYKVLTRIKQVEDQARALKAMNSGKTSPRVFSALRFFLVNIERTHVDEAIATPLPADAVSPDNFVPNNSYDEISDIPAFKGKDIGDLIVYLEKNNISMAFLQPAHRTMMAAVDAIAAPAEEKITTLRQYMDDIRQKHFDIWTAPWVGVFPGDFSGIRSTFPGGNPPPAATDRP